MVKVLIAGAGIGGLTAAIALRQLGCEVKVFEQAQSIRSTGTGLSIMANAMLALKEIGIEESIREVCEPIELFEVRSQEDRLIFTSPIKELSQQLGVPSVCVHRGDLLLKLAEHLPSKMIEFNSSLLGFAQDNDKVTALFADRQEEGDILIGADGFYSAIRSQLAAGSDPARPSGYIAWLATTPFHHPELTPGRVSHYWGHGKRFGVINIGQGRVYWWGTANGSQVGVAWKSRNRTEIAACFQGWPALVQACIEQTAEASILKIDTQDRKPLRTWGTGRVTLLGDAAHPMLTSLGQGAAQAIEDAVILARYLKKAYRHAQGLEAALRQYEAQRIGRTGKIVNVARYVSWYEQLEQPLACKLRDQVFRHMPEGILRKQTADLLQFT